MSKKYLKKVVIFISIVFYMYALSSCTSPGENATEIFYDNENNFEKAAEILSNERMELGVEKLAIFNGEIRTEGVNKLSEKSWEQVGIMSDIGVKSIITMDGWIYFNISGMAFSSETSILYVSDEVRSHSESNTSYDNLPALDNLPLLSDGWYLYDTSS